MNKEIFNFYKGRTYTRDIEVTGFTGEITEVYFTVCENANNKNFCLRKTLNNGITIADTGTNEEGEQYTVFNLWIDATDTDHMKADYEYGCDMTLISNDIKIPLVDGIVTLNGVYTKTCNECKEG